MKRARWALMVVAAALVAVSVSACGSTGSSGGATGTTSASKTLRFAFSTDPAPLDPDTFYESEGLIIMTAAYEGLLRYKPNSPQLEGQLASSWKASPDGKTYTFTLRQGVKFSDGTPFNSAAAKASFERRVALKGGPSYMLAHVTRMETPSPYSFVVHLDRPVAPFLDYLASPYGPLMSSPTAIAHHTAGGDHGSAWLASHSAGTGAFVLSEVQRGTRYTLTRNPYYASSKPYFTTVSISIVPNFETQLLEVEGGTLDLVLHGLPTQAVEGLNGNSSVQVQQFPALFQAELWVNPKSAVFADPHVRAALRASLENKQLTQQIWGSKTATPATTVYPEGMLPNGLAPLSTSYQPSLLAPALAPYRGKKVVIGWGEQSTNENLANLMQVRLQGLGLNASTQSFSQSVLFSLPEKANLRPDLFAITFNPDAVAPDTYGRIYWYTHAPVNLLGCSVPGADHLLDQAAEQASPQASQRLGAQAAIAYRESNCWMIIADVHDTIVMRKGLTGFDHQLPWIYDIGLASLRRE
jgi:peptide/nickel transport system substrate-binding protein